MGAKTVHLSDFNYTTLTKLTTLTKYKLYPELRITQEYSFTDKCNKLSMHGSLAGCRRIGFKFSGLFWQG